MRLLARVVLLTVATLVQATWPPRFEVLGAFPNLVLIAVIASACTLGPRAAMLWACAGGVLLDLTSSGPIGPRALALLPAAYVTALWTRDLRRVNGLHVALAAGLGTLVYSSVLVVADWLLGFFVPRPQTVAELAFAAAACNAVLAPFMFELVCRFQSGRSLPRDRARQPVNEQDRSVGTITRRAQA